MAEISSATLNSILDYLAQYWTTTIGTSGSGQGVGNLGGAWGAALAASNIQTTVQGCGDIVVETALGQTVINFVSSTDGGSDANQKITPLLTSLERHLSTFPANGGTLDSYLSYLNVGLGGTWTALQSPNFATAFAKFKGQALSRQNAYYEALGASGLGQQVVGGAYTAGTTIGSSYAGGFPYINIAGLTGAGTVTVTGTAFNPATQTAVPGSTWTYSAAGNGVFALTPGGGSPAPANSLILSVTAIASGGTISAGTLIAEAHRPAGRPSV